MCPKCRSVVESPSVPVSAGCPSGGSHLWVRLCNGSLVFREGLSPYQCRKCGTLIYCSGLPSSGRCPSGGSHLWTRI